MTSGCRYSSLLEKAKGIWMSPQHSWHISLSEASMTLGEALATVPSPFVEMPLMLRLQRDPNLSFLGQLVFREGLDQHQHDCIHILLGRGLLPVDQAFVLGFTLASSNKGSLPEHKLSAEIGRRFYKPTPLFDEVEAGVFKEGIKLAYMSFCTPLEGFDFLPWHDHSLSTVRDAVGVETDLLQAYFAVEKHRYPHSEASQRLIPNPAQIARI
jgi:hypothetical protein